MKKLSFLTNNELSAKNSLMEIRRNYFSSSALSLQRYWSQSAARTISTSRICPINITSKVNCLVLKMFLPERPKRQKKSIFFGKNEAPLIAVLWVHELLRLVQWSWIFGQSLRKCLEICGEKRTSPQGILIPLEAL